jgi:hypothetical protein
MSFGHTSEYNDNLKPCPFCGEEAWLNHVEFNDGDIWYNPSCSKCNGGWNENYSTKDEAINAWNNAQIVGK